MVTIWVSYFLTAFHTKFNYKHCNLELETLFLLMQFNKKRENSAFCNNKTM